MRGEAGARRTRQRRQQRMQLLGVLGAVVDAVDERHLCHQPAIASRREDLACDAGLQRGCAGLQCACEGVAASAARGCSRVLAGRLSPHASRSSAMVCRVVGTSSLRSLSSAACTDHASRAGSGVRARMCAGDGPTVETQT